MEKLFTRSFIRALIITAVSGLIIVGGVYAYETLWSGKAHITVEAPSGEAQLQITEVSVDEGTWDDATGVWTVSIPRGGDAALYVHLRNDGGDVIVVNGEAEGETHYYEVDGVRIWPDSVTLPGGQSDTLGFLVTVAADAEPGTLPEIKLEIRR